MILKFHLIANSDWHHGLVPDLLKNPYANLEHLQLTFNYGLWSIVLFSSE